MIGLLLDRLRDPTPLSVLTAGTVLDRLAAAETTDLERVAVLASLRVRGEDVATLTAFARALRARAVPFPVPSRDRVLDLCGSGGAPRPSFNVSTVSAFVVAAAGQPVVKHGNRSARGPCGSSDLLEALGLPVTRSVRFARESYRRHRLAFLHAPLYHPATAAVAAARRALGVPTIFNRLGPLVNPARPTYQVVGMPNPTAAREAAETLSRLGVRRGVAMTSAEGCDEFSPARPTFTLSWSRSRFRPGEVRPARLIPPEDRRGPWGPLPPAQAAEETERVLAGGDGARRGAVLLTAAAALRVARRSPTWSDAVTSAREALDSGAAEGLLRSLQSLGRSREWSGSGP